MGWAGYNAGITIGIRQTDGTVTVTHNGCEIGQGINTKVVQTVANQLGIDISLIRCTSTGTDKVANGGVTGGSGTSEVVCQAAVNACKVLNERLAPFVTNTTASNWAVKSTLKASYKAKDDWVALLSSLPSDVSLNAQGWYSPTANPNQQDFQYFVYGACVSEIELLTLTGEVHVLASEIVYDCGVSLNPAVDIGQIEGGLVMGLGYFLQEHVQYDSKTADLDTIGTWEYKPPNAQDVPSVFNVTLLPNLYNKDGILGSKATGEPPYILANSIYFATKMAIDSSRNYATRQSYQQLACPLTVDIRQQACMNSNTLNLCKSKSNNQSVNLRSKEFYMLPY